MLWVEIVTSHWGYRSFSDATMLQGLGYFIITWWGWRLVYSLGLCMHDLWWASWFLLCLTEMASFIACFFMSLGCPLFFFSWLETVNFCWNFDLVCVFEVASRSFFSMSEIHKTKRRPRNSPAFTSLVPRFISQTAFFFPPLTVFLLMFFVFFFFYIQLPGILVVLTGRNREKCIYFIFFGSGNTCNLTLLLAEYPWEIYATISLYKNFSMRLDIMLQLGSITSLLGISYLCLS